MSLHGQIQPWRVWALPQLRTQHFLMKSWRHPGEKSSQMCAVLRDVTLRAWHHLGTWQPITGWIWCLTSRSDQQKIFSILHTFKKDYKQLSGTDTHFWKSTLFSISFNCITDYLWMASTPHFSVSVFILYYVHLHLMNFVSDCLGLWILKVLWLIMYYVWPTRLLIHYVRINWLCMWW